MQLHNYKAMIIHTFHPKYSLQSLHYNSLSTFPFPLLLDVSSPRFKNPSLLNYNYFPDPLSKIRDLQGKVAMASAGSCSILDKEKRIFSFFKASRQTLEPTYLPIQSAP